MTMMQFKALGLVVLTAALVLACESGTRAAPTNDPFANEPNESNGISILRPQPEPRATPSVPAPQVGNPLWGVPLSALTATQDRPVFTPSRRPPARAVPSAPVVIGEPQRGEVAPEPLQLFLIGAVVGEGDAIAVFIDRSTQGIIRLRAGQTHAGWSLTSIQPREVTFTRGGESATVVIQRNDSNTPSSSAGLLPAATNVAPKFAPFVPRSTPRDGSSDGL